MKKLIIFVLVFTFSNIVYADGTYGCVIGQSGGFDWVHGVWKLTKYSNNRNVLISVKENGLKLEYKESDDELPNLLTCNNGRDSPFQNYKKDYQLNCMNSTGVHLIFSENSLKGGISYLFGSVSSSEKRDSLSVNTLTCTKF